MLHSQNSKNNNRYTRPKAYRKPFPRIWLPALFLIGAFLLYKEAPKMEIFKSKEKIDFYMVSEGDFECRGKQHCSEMESLEEAVYYLKYCPGVRIDGDDDGIPCEDKF